MRPSSLFQGRPDNKISNAQCFRSKGGNIGLRISENQGLIPSPYKHLLVTVTQATMVEKRFLSLKKKSETDISRLVSYDQRNSVPVGKQLSRHPLTWERCTLHSTIPVIPAGSGFHKSRRGRSPSERHTVILLCRLSGF